MSRRLRAVSTGLLPLAVAAVAWAAAPSAAWPANATAAPQQASDSVSTAEGTTAMSPTDSALEARVRELSSQLRCPTCRSLSIQDSPSEMAQQMRQVVREKLQAGESPEAIKGYFVDRYGEWILLKPKASGFNWTVWVLPLLLLAGGVIFVLTTARRWVERGREREAALLDGREGEV